MTKHLFRTFGAILIALLTLTVPAFGQTTTTSTTLSAAVTSTSQTSVVVAAATNVDAGGILYVDREAMQVVSVSSTTVRVIRGVEGTRPNRHVTGAQVWVAAKLQKSSVFVSTYRSGACTAASEAYLPQIDLLGGGIYDCPSAVGQWVNLRNQIVVTCRALLIADMIDQSCFTADRPYLLVKITEVHTTAESAGTLTLIPKRQQSTEAPASGDALVATAIDMVGAGAVAQTVKTPTLTATATFLKLETGDRLGLDFTDDTAGELAGVVVTFYLILL